MELDKTTREQRRQTLAKLVLGHLIDIRITTSPPRSEWKAEVRHCIGADRGLGAYIYGEGFSQWPSEKLCAIVALALDGRAYDSCRINDLDAHTVDSVLGDTEPLIPWGAPR